VAKGTRVWTDAIHAKKHRAIAHRGEPAPKHRERRPETLAMTDGDAEMLAKYWWGEKALASPSNGRDEPFGVGYWQKQGDDDFGHFVCLGIGDTWEEAFCRADLIRWKGFLVERRKRKEPQ
jgi:hypothetical protein